MRTCCAYLASLFDQLQVDAALWNKKKRTKYKHRTATKGHNGRRPRKERDLRQILLRISEAGWCGVSSAPGGLDWGGELWCLVKGGQGRGWRFKIHRRFGVPSIKWGKRVQNVIIKKAGGEASAQITESKWRTVILPTNAGCAQVSVGMYWLELKM